ncbi:PilZ domain-containing protein [Pseudomonas brenneri]|uniref:PilZ domain-containing protein n=2 Tax=Pseudomonas brenneri TaxID=129817 RepID=A0ABY0WF34_9PSED|nr:hypothetical protein [Pseudomonas sp. 25 R 14]SDV02608.1 PilZ domain-containing protein [Pseudomonas brenneri]
MQAALRPVSQERPESWPLDGDLSMFTDRRIERHQLPGFLQVFNRFTDKPIGYLGNISSEGLMLISQLPMMVNVDFELRLKIPGPEGDMHAIDFTATCLWSREDINPLHYDSGFILLQAPAEYGQLMVALLQYFSFYPLQTSA